MSDPKCKCPTSLFSPHRVSKCALRKITGVDKEIDKLKADHKKDMRQQASKNDAELEKARIALEDMRTVNEKQKADLIREVEASRAMNNELAKVLREKEEERKNIDSEGEKPSNEQNDVSTDKDNSKKNTETSANNHDSELAASDRSHEQSQIGSDAAEKCMNAPEVPNTADAAAGDEEESEDCELTESDEDSLNGKGTIEFSDGITYEGDYQNGVPHGTGTMKFEDGVSYYKGEWKNGKMDGEGHMQYTQSAYYQGQWNNGKRHGQGSYREDRVSFTGEWRNDKRFTGSGTAKYGTFMFCGKWLEGKRHGPGHLMDENDSFDYSERAQYSGEWNKDKLEGMVKINFGNGNTYEGMYMDGNPHGRGTMKFENQNEYTGDWRKGVMHGYGTMKYYLPRGEYHGEWRNNNWNGSGQYTNSKYDRYEGVFRDGFKHFRGSLQKYGKSFSQQLEY